MTDFYSEGKKWMDSILTVSTNRTLWEQATLEAMREAQPQLESEDLFLPKFRKHSDNFLSPTWNNEFADPDECYWRRFIPEGIYIAAKIKKEADLPERR